ncbi:unnamed protein product [Brachionus calyciflorus]|uniref:Uncharacterized protein n=1 Tax=Brachionus calyciflorus TaxID=104777 RepID=A0A813TJG0_9BILA|nr:unnamed protein product [Brachionus calyciflorus]
MEKNIVLLDNLYKNHFQNVIFCGGKILNKLSGERGLRKKFDSYTFIEMINFDYGRHHYFCMSKAIEMGFKTQGFLLLSDDIMIKIWNLKKMDSTKVWFSSDIILGLDPSSKIEWYHWSKVRNYVYLLNHLKKIDESNLSNSETRIVKDYLKNINLNQEFVSNVTKVTYTGSDIFYIPKEKFASCYYINRRMRRYRVFLEIAVPMILAGLDTNKNIQKLNGYYEWNKKPLNYDLNYKQIDFFHPFKLSKIDNYNVGRNYCKNYVVEYFFNSFENLLV